MKVFIVIGNTESGDRVGPMAFEVKPTPKQLERILREDYPQEFEDGPGPGFAESYIHLDRIYGLKVRK